MSGNQGNNRIIWQPWQLQFLKKNWQQMTAQQLSDSLGLSRTIVRRKKYELGFLLQIMEYWTAEQINFLKRNYKTIGDTELAQIFNKKWKKQKGWTHKHIEKKRRYLNLKRTPEQNRKIHARNTKNGMFAMCPVKAWITRGGVAPEGDLRMQSHQGNPVMVIKHNGTFIHYARYLYRKEIGDIPTGYVVRIKDGNPYNVTVQNLELLSRKQNAALNTNMRNNLEYKRAKAISNLKYHIEKIKKIQA